VASPIQLVDAYLNSKSYNSTGKHLLLITCKVTSSEAVLPILPKLHSQHCALYKFTYLLTQDIERPGCVSVWSDRLTLFCVYRFALQDVITVGETPVCSV